jgi:hypothetical protein
MTCEGVMTAGAKRTGTEAAYAPNDAPEYE